MKKIAEFEGHFRSNVAATEDDVVDPLWADVKGTSQGVLGNAYGYEVVLEENFAEVDGGFQSGRLINRFRAANLRYSRISLR